MKATRTKSLIYIPIYLYLLIKSRSNTFKNTLGLLLGLCPRSFLKANFVNANASFQPTYENASSTYTVTFAISGTGNLQYNTTTAQIYSV